MVVMTLVAKPAPTLYILQYWEVFLEATYQMCADLSQAAWAVTH